MSSFVDTKPDNFRRVILRHDREQSRANPLRTMRAEDRRSSKTTTARDNRQLAKGVLVDAATQQKQF